MILSLVIPGGSGDVDTTRLLNPFLNRTIFFYELKTKKGEKFFFNTKSSFYNFEEYLIDRVDKY